MGYRPPEGSADVAPERNLGEFTLITEREIESFENRIMIVFHHEMQKFTFFMMAFFVAWLGLMLIVAKSI